MLLIFFVRDDAFAVSDNLLAPWPGQELHEEEDAFNFYLSHLRQTIEQSFGMLNGRWGVLWRPIQLSLKSCRPLVGALMKLQNFIIDSLHVDQVLPRASDSAPSE